MALEESRAERRTADGTTHSVGLRRVAEGEFAYDAAADEWTVSDDTFHTAGSLSRSNQELGTSVRGGSEFPGRGVPGEGDRLPRREG